MHLLTPLLLALPALSAPTAPAPKELFGVKPFYLVTTPYSTAAPNGNSSLLANVSATSLFLPYPDDPSARYYLRTIGPGYGSVPQFTLTDMTLHTMSGSPFGGPTVMINSTRQMLNESLGLEAKNVKNPGNLDLLDGYLLTANLRTNEKIGWYLCAGPLGEEIIVWKPKPLATSNCTQTYVQAVAYPPY